jgi:transcriptional regulator with XRE-family HTH domain
MQAELFTEWLKAERTRRGLTQRDLSELSGVHHSTIAQVEQGTRNPSADFVIAIGEAFECTPKETMTHLFQVGVRKKPVDIDDADDSKLIADFLRITRGKPKRAIKSALIGFEQILISESRYAKE